MVHCQEQTPQDKSPPCHSQTQARWVSSHSVFAKLSLGWSRRNGLFQMGEFSRLMVFMIAAAAAPLAISHAKTTTKEQLLKKQVQKTKEMEAISRQLGVTCSYCHNVKNFEDPHLKTYQIAKEHIRITQWLNKSGFRGKPKVTCYVCHKGQAQFSYTPGKKERAPQN